ncbi:MAG: hypothetical protein LAO31_14545 [Acidobacteriia bacterium]|nr:hypothetical protein [Terriglobia bacterium]
MTVHISTGRKARNAVGLARLPFCGGLYARVNRASWPPTRWIKMPGPSKPLVQKTPCRKRRAEEGQVLLEFLINFLIFFFLIWSLVIITMIAGTKLLTNYAAFAAARAWSVNIDNNDDMDKAKDAAKDVLGAMNWGSGGSGIDVNKASCHGVGSGGGGGGGGGGSGESACIEVSYQTTLGIPTFLAGTSSSAVKTIGRAPMIQENIKKNDEKGDNK